MPVTEHSFFFFYCKHWDEAAAAAEMKKKKLCLEIAWDTMICGKNLYIQMNTRSTCILHNSI